MTITITSIVAGPYTATGAAQNLPFAFKVFTPEEIEVVVGADKTPVDPSLYTVTRNLAVDDQVLEGGSVSLLAGAVEAGASIRLIANPHKTQELVFSDTGSRLRNLNEVADRATLRALRATYDGVMEGAGQEVLDLAAAAGAAAGAAAASDKADRTGANITPTDAPLFRGKIQAAAAVFKRGAASRNTLEKLAERVSVRDYGAFGDGESHTLAATAAFGGENTTGWTLAQWQVYFPGATALSQEIDFLAHAEAVRQAKSASKPLEIFVPAGRYRLGADGLVVSNNGTTIRGEGPNATIWMSSKATGDIFTFKDMATGGIFSGTIAPLVVRTDGAAVRFDNGHNLVSRHMKFDPGAWHGGAAGAEHWSCYDMTAGDAQFLYTVDNFEMNDVRHGFRIGHVGGYVQDVWIGKGVCVARRGGLLAYNVGGLYIDNKPDFLGCRWGLQVIPGAGQMVSGMMVTGLLADTCEFHGVAIQPTPGGSVVDFQMSDVWSSSSGTTVPGGETSPGACGIYIDGSDGYVGGGIINGPRCVNNTSHGIHIRNASEITISNPQCNYNSVRSPGSFNGIQLDAGAKNITIVGGFCGPTGKFKKNGVPTTQYFGVFIFTGAENVKVIYVDVDGNLQPGVNNGGTNCFVVTPGSGGGGGGGTVTGPINQPGGTTNVMGEISQNVETANRFGRMGLGRNPIAGQSLATRDPIAVGGFEPIVGFNAYYDISGGTWRYQGNGPAAALTAKSGGLRLILFADNSSGVDAPATISSFGMVQKA